MYLADTDVLDTADTDLIDIYMAADLEADDAVTIDNFGADEAGSDILYIGTGFTLNTGDLEDGNVAVSEVFFIQDGDSTIVTLETETWGSASDDVLEITLTGVTATDLVFADGQITLA